MRCVNFLAMKVTKDLSDTEWELLKPLFPELRPKEDGRGRPVADTSDPTGPDFNRLHLFCRDRSVISTSGL